MDSEQLNESPKNQKIINSANSSIHGISETGFVLKIGENGSVVVRGLFFIHVVIGHVDISGYHHGVDSKTLKMASLGAGELITLKNMSHNRENVQDMYHDAIAWMMENAAGFSSVQPSDSVVVLFDGQWIEQFISRISPYTSLFDDLNLIPFAKTSLAHDYSEEDCFQVKNEWKDLSIDMEIRYEKERKLKAIVLGNSGVGKSFFLRYLTNRMLNITDSVLYIDLDIGQSEFTPSGCISATIADKPLLGPNFTRMEIPDKCYYIGAISITEDPVILPLYKRSICELLSYCQTNHRNKPWVINTMGYIKGAAASLILELLRLIQPTNSIYIRGIDEDNNEDYALKFKCTDLLPSLCYSQNNRSGTSKTKRELVAVAYFFNFFGNNVDLSNIPPQSLIIGQFKIRLHSQMYDSVNTFALNSICGRFIALCSPSDDLIECHGYGLFRGFDFKENKVYITTPVTNSVMEKVSLLCTSRSIGLPDSFYFTQEPGESFLSFVSRIKVTDNLHTEVGRTSSRFSN